MEEEDKPKLSNFEFFIKFISVLLIGIWLIVTPENHWIGVINGILLLIAIGFSLNLEDNAKLYYR